MNQSQENSQTTQFDQLSELKKQISINSALIVDIVSDDDKFIQKLKDLNESGIACILKENYFQSLIYLQEAQKILEFAANCGKTIDRVIIIHTLQNQACIYQRLWELEKASSYLQAIIYNMNAYIECVPDMIMVNQIFNSFSQSYNNLSTFINKRLNISMYYLKFSAINSQMKKHEIALNSAFKALSVLKLVCEQCYNYERYVQKTQPSHQLRIILKELSSVKQTVDPEKTSKYFKLAQKGIFKLKQKGEEEGFPCTQKQLQELQAFSIGQIMQISPISIDNLEKVSSLEDEVSYMKKMYKVLYISISYFAIATELRLTCDEIYTQEEKKKSSQFIKSQLFHLNCIIIACKYLPQFNKYVQHILKSFTNHYEVDLEGQIDYSKEEQNQFDQHNLIVHDNPDKNCKVILEEVEDDSNVLKQKRNQSTKLNTFTTQRSSFQYPKTPIVYEMDKKKKEKERVTGKKDKSKSKCKSIEKIIDNPLLVKNNYFHTLKRRKSSIQKSKEKFKPKMSPVSNFQNITQNKGKSKEKLHKVKSKDKSKSKSNRQISYEKKEKSTDRKKKIKNTKMQQEYFMKMNTKKKIGTPKPTNTPRVKINDYMCVSPSKMQQLLKLSVGKTTTNKVHKY